MCACVCVHRCLNLKEKKTSAHNVILLHKPLTSYTGGAAGKELEVADRG